MTARRAVVLAAALVAAALLPGLLGAPAATTAATAESTIMIEYDGEGVTVENTTGQTIAGSADLDPGTELTVTVQATTDTEPRFFKTDTVTVNDDGRWATTFDFSGQTAGDRFSVNVEAANGDASANATGEVIACEANCATDAPASKITIDHDGENVTVANASSQVVSGTADAPKGTEVNVRLQSTGDTQPRFFKIKSAVVTDDGTWAVGFNLSGMPAGGTFAVEATIEDTDQSATADGTIVACEGDCTDQPPEDTPTPIPEQTPTATPTGNAPPVALNGSAVSAVRGEVAAIELSFNGADAAVLTIGDEESVNYELRALVRDADADGDAVLYLDTALAGREGNPVSVSAGDEVRLQSETKLGSMLDAGNYEVTLHAGEDADGEPTTLGTLLVQDSAESTPAGDETATETDRPKQGGPLDNLGGTLLSLALLVSGGAVALLLVRG